MNTIEQAEAFYTNLKRLGYEKKKVGSWVEKLTPTDTGFPIVSYTCPFCGHEEPEQKPYCAECGAKLE